MSLSVHDMSISADGKPFVESYDGAMRLEDRIDVAQGDQITHIRYQSCGPGEGSEHKPWEDAS
jgi:hypothetical protein